MTAILDNWSNTTHRERKRRQLPWRRATHARQTVPASRAKAATSSVSPRRDGPMPAVTSTSPKKQALTLGIPQILVPGRRRDGPQPRPAPAPGACYPGGSQVIHKGC